MQPFVSVIVPVRDDFGRARRLFHALLNQTWPKSSFEVVVCDNGSADVTLDELRNFLSGLSFYSTVVQETTKRNSYAARNAGVRQAKGEILAFTDSDCLPTHDWIEQGVNALVASMASLAAGRIKFTFLAKMPNTWEYFDASRNLNQQHYVEAAGFGATANLFTRKSVFEMFGLFRDDLVSGGDYEFCRRLTGPGEKLIYADRSVVYHPARSSFRQVFVKGCRIAKGQKQLHAIGLLDHSRLSWRQILPTKNAPLLRGFRIAASKRLKLILIENIYRYQNLLCRL